MTSPSDEASKSTKAFSKRQLIRSSLLMMGSTFVSYTTGLVATTLTARALGPAEYGRFAYLIWLSGVLMICANNGVNVTAIRYVSEFVGKHHFGKAQSVQRWLRHRFYISLVIVAFFTLLWASFAGPDKWGAVWWVFIGIVLISSLSKATYLYQSSVVKGYGIFSIEAVTTNILSLATLFGSIALFWLKAPLEGFLILFMIASLGHMIVTWLQTRRLGFSKEFEALEPREISDIRTHFTWAVALTVIAALSNKSVEIFLLGHYSSSEAIAYFTLASGLTKGGTDLLCAGLTTILLPVQSHALGAQGDDGVKRISRVLVRIYFFIGIWIVGGAFFIANSLVTLLYGAEFHDVIMVFQIMAVVAGITLIEVPLGSLLSTTNNLPMRVSFAASSVVLTFITAFALIPHYGLMGALTAHAISRILIVLVLAHSVSRRLGMPLPFLDFVKIALAGLLMASVVVLARKFAEGIAVDVASAAVFCMGVTILTWLFKVWNQDEINLVGGFLRGVLTRLRGNK